MNVGIDITPIAYGRGVSRYTSNIVDALSKQPLSLSLFGVGWGTYGLLQKYTQQFQHANKISTAVIKRPLKIHEYSWHYGLSSVRSYLPTINVFHSWDWLQPPDKDLPLVSTIHDLAILKYPETAHPDVLQHHQASWDILKKRQAHIVTVSQSTKKDICTLLDIPSQKITVIPEALPVETRVASALLTEELLAKTQQKLPLDKPFILAVGTREPRKNLLRLMQAWQPLAKDVDLLIAGEAGWDDSQTKALSLQHQPRFLGKVSDLELAVLYGEAEAFVYPSLDEGFGLPILEAFHHGTPVVTSNCSAMPEVAGNAAVLIDPVSVDSITAGITQILGENQEQQRERLQKMIIRLHLFSWDKAAKQLCDVYTVASHL
jgi:glycosyltransferase involved in cell wall biosynthesis